MAATLATLIIAINSALNIHGFFLETLTFEPEHSSKPYGVA